ncbi:MAG: deoxyribodipyrimidine photo-lyase, partial [Nevskia sp.]|nr:deoxyribodipyrimidine photo-lyase [Nevskia sp.]
MSTAILWFRRDLRLADNPALRHALQRHRRVLPLYIHEPDEESPWAAGGASRWWLHHSLAALAADLAVAGAPLTLLAETEGDVARVVFAVDGDAAGADASPPYAAYGKTPSGLLAPWA